MTMSRKELIEKFNEAMRDPKVPGYYTVALQEGLRLLEQELRELREKVEKLEKQHRNQYATIEGYQEELALSKATIDNRDSMISYQVAEIRKLSALLGAVPVDEFAYAMEVLRMQREQIAAASNTKEYKVLDMCEKTGRNWLAQYAASRGDK